MVIDFSLDTAAEKIHNPKTREYFQEVLESYNIGNYRATIVMLYSIVVCDLVYKLQELKDIYNDKKATRLLNDLERRQKENPRSSDWEIELIKAVDERTLLIDVSTFENISILQKHRHLCAHPVMDENYELYKPNKETTRAHLRNMLESVFMRSPILSKDIFNELIVDLSEKKDYFPPKFENKDLEIYLKTKYLKHSPPKTIEYIFKNLWKFTFKLTNDDARDNRGINYSVLYILLKNYEKKLLEFIEDNKSHFSEIEKEVPCQFLLSFISIFPSVYDLLLDHAKVMIKKESNRQIDFKVKSWYLSPTMEKHIEEIKEAYEKIPRNLNFYGQDTSKRYHFALVSLIRNTSRYDICEPVINYAIEIYSNSGSYADANEVFNELISPSIQYMNKANLLNLLEGIEGNDQTYHRRDARFDHLKILNFINGNYEKEIDVDKFPNFKNSIDEIITEKVQSDSEDIDLPF